VKEYKITVKLGEIDLNLSATNEDEALDNAKEIIREQFGYDFQKNVEYEIEKGQG
jgi:hypothetical protein